MNGVSTDLVIGYCIQDLCYKTPCPSRKWKSEQASLKVSLGWLLGQWKLLFGEVLDSPKCAFKSANRITVLTKSNFFKSHQKLTLKPVIAFR